MAKMHTYRVLQTCWRTDIGPVARRFMENDLIEVPFKIDSPKFEFVSTRGEEPVAQEKVDPQLQSLLKARAAKAGE